MGGNGTGFSKPRIPKFLLPRTTLFSTRSPYVPGISIPTPHGRDPTSSFAGTVRLLLLTTWFRRKMVQRATCALVIVGVGEVFCAESHVPSCGGGMSFG